MVTSVSSLRKTIRSVEDEASRGVRAIESAIDEIKQAVIVSAGLFKTMHVLVIAWRVVLVCVADI